MCLVEVWSSTSSWFRWSSQWEADFLFLACSAVFRKMFPEYVEKHQERQRAAELEAERLLKLKDSPAVLEEPASGAGNDVQLKKGARLKQSRRFPIWLTALLVAVFASVMALPLLTLDLTHSSTWEPARLTSSQLGFFFELSNFSQCNVHWSPPY